IAQRSIDIKILPDLHGSDSRQQVMVMTVIQSVAANDRAQASRPIHCALVGGGIIIIDETRKLALFRLYRPDDHFLSKTRMALLLEPTIAACPCFILLPQQP